MNVVERFKASYDFGKVDHLFRREFYIWKETEKRWRDEGWNGDYDCFRYDTTLGLGDAYAQNAVSEGIVDSTLLVGNLFLGWTEAPMVPAYKEEIIKTDGTYEYWRFPTGAIRKYTLGNRTAIMPLFVRSPVESRQEWDNTVKPRLDPNTPERWERFDEHEMKEIGIRVNEGTAVFTARTIGGYMYLRSLLGPEKVLYLFYDDPGMLHDMMKVWLNLAITCLSRIQDFVPFFRLYIGEDIAFRSGPLVSPKIVNEFLMPYYKELFQTLKNRQKEFMHIELDSDGNPDKLMPLYIENGITALSPCEIAADCDPVTLAKKYPELALGGGIDKRVLSKGKDEIKREVDRVVPIMKERGAYIPMCDHGVPPDVSFKNYVFFREYITSLD